MVWRKVLDLLLVRLKDKGLVKERGKQRSDSTHVIGAVRDLNRLELAGECVRAALEAITAASPGWIERVLEVSGWAERYRTRVDSLRLPASATKRDGGVRDKEGESDTARVETAAHLADADSGAVGDPRDSGVSGD